MNGWRDGVVPLRKKFDFRVDGAWVARERNAFVWILSYESPEDWSARDEADYSSPETKALDRDPARLIAHAEQMLHSTSSRASRETMLAISNGLREEFDEVRRLDRRPAIAAGL
jgi:hypothetical protein